MARLLANERITAAGHFQDTRHLEFDLASSGLAYEPGGLLAVLPAQPHDALANFMHRLGLDADAWVRVEATDLVAAGQRGAVEVDFPLTAPWKIMLC
jgi:sulfite reductase alpha subunit-like flavoprotein